MVLTPGQTAVLIWFCSSVALSVFSHVAFHRWLRSRGMPVRSALVGIPGRHLDEMYVEWCRSRGRSPRRILILRWLSYANLVLAIGFTLALLATGL